MSVPTKRKRKNEKVQTDKQKKSVYFPLEMVDVLNAEANKWGVSFSKILCDCVSTAMASGIKRPVGVIAFTDLPKGDK